MKSIQNKILLVVISGLLVVTAVVTTIGVSMTHNVMHQDADRILKNATQREAAYLNDVLGDMVKSCNIMEHYATNELEAAEKLRDPAIRAEYLEKTETMFSEIAVNTDGVAGFYMRLAPEYTDGLSGFYNLVNQDKSFTAMPLTDLNKYARDDKQNVSWYYEPVNAGEGVWLDPYYFPGNDNQMITYAQPLYVEGNLVGVVGFDLDFGYLVARINEIAVFEDGYAQLIAKDGVTVYNQVKEEDHSGHDPQSEAKVELKNGMFLVTHAAYKDIQEQIHPILYKIVVAFVVVLFCAIVYTVAVTRKIVGPLKQLTAVAKKLSLGKGAVEVEQIVIDSKDEIGVLSTVLSDTYAKIREYTAYINALAYRDSLTGIKNSTAYTEAIEELNKTICTGNPQFGVLVADINNLKQTNDRYGHDIGNDLIVHTAKILTDIFKESAVFRIGGDEFVVLLQREDYANYRALLEKLDKACAEDYITVSEKTIPVAVARGVALYDRSIDRVYEDVFSKADHAMYMNKHESKATEAH